MTASFSSRLIAWQSLHGRHHLPWQVRDAYRVWLSEIMLQQTQVATVLPYYERFLERFPDVQTLAAATVDEVMPYWSGLGYYSRARNLHRAAQQVVADFGGAFPHDPALLETLPGVGRSTAAAIAAFAYGVRAAILDGNVKRVLARHAAVEGHPGEARVLQRLWLEAESRLPDAGIEAYTQGLMDLGSLVCTRSRPACLQCPVAEDCQAREQGRQHVLPTKRPRKEVPERSCRMLVLRQGTRLLLQARSGPGVWQGLVSLPEAPLDQPPSQALAALGLRAYPVAELPPFEHVFSHYRLQVQPSVFVVEGAEAVAEGGEGLFWHEVDRVAELALPAPVRRLLTTLPPMPDQAG